VKRPSRGWRIVQAVLVCAAIGFLGYRVTTNMEAIRGFPWRIDPSKLAGSLVLHVGVLVFGTFVWSRVLTRFDVPAIPPSTLLRIWSTSTVARYIPGTVWQFVVGAKMAGRYSVDPLLLLASLSVHVGITLASASVVAGAMLPLYSARLPWWSVLTAPVSIVLVHPKVIDGARGLLSRISRRELPRWRGGWTDGIGLLALNVLSWLTYGTAFWMLLASVSDLPLSTLPATVGIHALTFVAGYAAFFMPAGLGVRESALALLLGPYFPSGVAVTLSAFTRLWTIAAEIGTMIVSLSILRPPARNVAGTKDERRQE
jgi:hypothetical protein